MNFKLLFFFDHFFVKLCLKQPTGLVKLFLCRLYQFAIDKFAESFENAGPNAMEIISSLYAEHASGNSKVRIDLEEGICEDVSDMNIRDLHDTKSKLFCYF